MPDPENDDNTPPTTVTTFAVKLFAGSERANEITAVWPAVSVRDSVNETSSVGDVTSRATDEEAGDADDGPELPEPSRAPPAANTGRIDPPEQPEIVTVYTAPDPETVNTQPVAVPELAKSADSTPVTDSENVNVNVTVPDDDVDPTDGTNDWTTGAVESPIDRTVRHRNPVEVRRHCSTPPATATKPPSLWHRRPGATEPGAPEPVDETPRHCNLRATRVHRSTSLPVRTTRPSIRHFSPARFGVSASGTAAVVGRHCSPRDVRVHRKFPAGVITTRPSFRHESPLRRSTRAEAVDCVVTNPADRTTTDDTTTRRAYDNERITTTPKRRLWTFGLAECPRY